MSEYPNTFAAMQLYGLLLTDEQLKKYAREDKVSRHDLRDDICDNITASILLKAILRDVLGKGYQWSDDPQFKREFYVAAQNKGLKVTPRGWYFLSTKNRFSRFFI